MSWRARGLRPWVWQRLSAVYLGGFLLYALFTMARLPASHAAWRAWLADPWVNAAAVVFVLALLVHVWVGVRDVVLDYLKPAALRMGVLAGLVLGLAALGGWALRLLLTVEAP